MRHPGLPDLNLDSEFKNPSRTIENREFAAPVRSLFREPFPGVRLWCPRQATLYHALLPRRSATVNLLPEEFGRPVVVPMTATVNRAITKSDPGTRPLSGPTGDVVSVPRQSPGECHRRWVNRTQSNFRQGSQA